MRSWILATLLVTGCSRSPITVGGQKYVLVHPGHKNSNGTSDVPLYQKVGDTNMWYTPSLTGRDMISIMK